MLESKIMTASEAVKKFLKTGDTLMIGGFPHMVPNALIHEVIRQGIKDLTLIKEAPYLVGDMLVGTGSVKKLVFGFLGVPGMGTCPAIRRAIEKGIPQPLEIEEYSFYSFFVAIHARVLGLSFLPINSVLGSDVYKHNPKYKTIDCPYTGQKVCVVPAMPQADVAIIHAQRADEFGNVQVWGISGIDQEIAFISKRVIVSVEELVTNEDIRRDPNRTSIPGFKVDAVVVEPFGAHPAHAQGFYDRDDDFYLNYVSQASTQEGFAKFMAEWVYGVKDRREYLNKLGASKLISLRAKPYMSSSVNYGY